MVYYFCHCMSLHVCLGDFVFIILDSRLAKFYGKQTVFSFWLSACSVLIVVPLL